VAVESREAAYGPVTRRTLGSPVLFSVVYTAIAAGIYFGLGVVADRALGLTPLVLLATTAFFGLAAMTYVEAASLHQDRGGATVFARYAFNELVSFVAGWVVILDYVILVAVCAVSATHYAAGFWSPLDEGALATVIAVGIVLAVAVGAGRGFSARRFERLAAIAVADLLIQVVLVVVGLLAFFSPSVLLDPIELGTAPGWDEVVFSIGVASVVFIGLESASGLSGEVEARRRDLKRLIWSASISVAVLYVGISLVGLTALPVSDGETALGGAAMEAPVLGITGALEQAWLRDGLTYVVAAAATVTLFEAAASAMLGLSRLSYVLATNRQIPSALGRLHPTRGTPVVVIGLAAVLAAGLAIPGDVELLIGIYAFGALLGLTIAHASVLRLRVIEPDRRRPYRIPFSVRVRGIELPVPALVGLWLSTLTWASVVVLHEGARYVGSAWLLGGILLYVLYRTTQEKSLLKRVTVPEKALRRDRAEAAELADYGSILVPIMGTALDDDIVQTAGRLAGDLHDDFDDEHGATIEALWVFEVPMSLPIDGRLPDAQLRRARKALARAKAVGEEYQGVEVATATVRARRAGQAIVEEARRRGVEAIVLAAEEPSRIRGGALLGGRSGANDLFVGDVTKYVLAKADCQVILTAPGRAEAPAASR
jgi:APA family basic amino acid/polyamine antiporter